MRFSFHIEMKKLKKIPKRRMFLWIILTFFLFCFFVALWIPTYHELEKVEYREIEIQEIDIRRPIGPRGSLFHLSIYGMDGENYYLRCTRYNCFSQFDSREYLEKIKDDLLTGKIKAVKVKIVSSHSTIWDFLLNRKKVVDLRTSDSVYYSIETEQEQLLEKKISTVIVFFVLLLVWLIDSAYIVVIHDLIRKSKSNRLE